MRLGRIEESINITIDKKYVQNIKEGSKGSKEKNDEEDLKEEEVEEEADEEEEKPEAEQEEDE